MSWMVDGRMYHSVAERDAAQRRLNARQAQSDVQRARQREAELQSRVRDSERRLAEARGNLEEQTRLNAAIRADVSQLEGVQQRLASRQTEMAREMRDEFADIRRTAKATQQELAALEREHEQHVAEVEATFTQVREEMREGFSEAQRRLRESESRLRSEIADVDAKVEEDRRRRLEAIADENDRAEEAIRAVESILVQLDPDLTSLGLEEEAQGLREQLTQARSARARGDSTAALAQASAAFGSSLNLRYRDRSRRAALRAHRAAIVASADELMATLDADKEVHRWFPQEYQQLRLALETLRQRAQARYVRYPRLEVEAAEDERILERLAHHVDVMVSSTQAVAQLSEERAVAVEKLVGRLAQVYGPLRVERCSQRFALADDPKSALLVSCAFNGAIVDVRAELDRRITVDGYGHSSNIECEAQANQVVAALEAENTIGGSRVSATNRAEPLAEEQAETSAWQNLSADLARTVGQL